jgi:hypothetical protein
MNNLTEKGTIEILMIIGNNCRGEIKCRPIDSNYLKMTKIPSIQNSFVRRIKRG